MFFFAWQAFNFAFRGCFKTFFGRSKEKDGYLKWFAGNVASRVLLGQLLPYFSIIWIMHVRTLPTDRIAELYRGFGVSIVGITLYRGLYFGIYDTLKPLVLIRPFDRIFESSFVGRRSIIKECFSKKYRHPTLDAKLTLKCLIYEITQDYKVNFYFLIIFNSYSLFNLLK